MNGFWMMMKRRRKKMGNKHRSKSIWPTVDKIKILRDCIMCRQRFQAKTIAKKICPKCDFNDDSEQ